MTNKQTRHTPTLPPFESGQCLNQFHHFQPSGGGISPANTSICMKQVARANCDLCVRPLVQSSPSCDTHEVIQSSLKRGHRSMSKNSDCCKVDTTVVYPTQFNGNDMALSWNAGQWVWVTKLRHTLATHWYCILVTTTDLLFIIPWYGAKFPCKCCFKRGIKT